MIVLDGVDRLVSPFLQCRTSVESRCLYELRTATPPCTLGGRVGVGFSFEIAGELRFWYPMPY